MSENQSQPSSQPSSDDREREVLEQLSASEPSLVREFIDFLKENKKWWLTPIIVVICLLIFLVVLSLSPAAPFIYTLF